MDIDINELVQQSVESTFDDDPEVKQLVSKYFNELLNDNLTDQQQQDRIEGIIKGLTTLGAVSGAQIALTSIENYSK